MVLGDDLQIFHNGTAGRIQDAGAGIFIKGSTATAGNVGIGDNSPGVHKLT